MTRRHFLVGSGVTAGTALAAGATQVSWSQLMAAAGRDPLPDGASVLVLVTLYGGNDGLNTVVPAADPAYRRLRPELAYAQDEVLALDDGLGLNPALKGFAGAWKAGELAVVRGVSYPQPDRSHFRSMAIWQTASPRASVPSGWLGRWLDTGDGDPLRAVSIGSTVTPALAGERTAGAALPLQRAELPRGWNGTLAALGRPEAGEHPYTARAARCMADLLRVQEDLGSLTADEDEAGADGRDAGGASAGGQSQLRAQLDVAARAIAAGVPTRVYDVSLGGFDTHANEKGTQTRILGELDEAVTAFRERVRKEAPGRDVVVAVYSEFGRRVAANANQGTDHGTSGPVFVLGPRVEGGFYGDQPPLDDLDGEDLKVTTDFRDVYATLLRDVLDADPARILAGHTGSTPFLRT